MISWCSIHDKIFESWYFDIVCENEYQYGFMIFLSFRIVQKSWNLRYCILYFVLYCRLAIQSLALLPSYPNSLFDIFEQKLKDEDFESQTFFHCNVDAKNNSVEVFLNDKRYFVQPNRKLPCDLKHIIAKYIFSIYDHGDVKYPFDNNKIDNVLQGLSQLREFFVL